MESLSFISQAPPILYLSKFATQEYDDESQNIQDQLMTTQ